MLIHCLRTELVALGIALATTDRDLKGLCSSRDTFRRRGFIAPWMNQWRQPGQMAYAMGGPPPEYTMPITVEAIEPVRTMVPDNFGIMVPRMINQVFMYNAYYYPQFGRWGYMNRHGFFVWVTRRWQSSRYCPRWRLCKGKAPLCNWQLSSKGISRSLAVAFRWSPISDRGAANGIHLRRS